MICFKRKDASRGIVAFIFLLFLCNNAFAQNNDNYVDLTVYAQPSAVFNTEELLENSINASNIFKLTVETKDNHASIYAAIPAGIKTSSNVYIPSNLLSLTLNNTNCAAGQKRQVVTTPVTMSSTPKLLFQQGKKGNYSADWYYDIELEALGYTYAPGTYNFVIQFTMTQP